MYLNNIIIFQCQLSFAQFLFPVLLVFLSNIERRQLISFSFLMKSRLSSQFGCLLKASEVCCFLRFELSFRLRFSFMFFFGFVSCSFIILFVFYFVFTIFICLKLYFIIFGVFGFYTLFRLFDNYIFGFN
jgi:hypothetical protein